MTSWPSVKCTSGLTPTVAGCPDVADSVQQADMSARLTGSACTGAAGGALSLESPPEHAAVQSISSGSAPRQQRSRLFIISIRPVFNFHKREFQELWAAVNRKYAYVEGTKLTRRSTTAYRVVLNRLSSIYLRENQGAPGSLQARYCPRSGWSKRVRL